MTAGPGLAAAGQDGSGFDPLIAERRYLSPGLALAHRFAGGGAWEVSSAGAWVTLSDGRRLLDFGSYGVCLLGHRHPAVVAAVSEQLHRLPASTRSLASEPAPRLAERLTGYFAPGPLRRCWFGLNGADAVELALKLARASTGRPRVIAATGAFHGKTLGALSVTWHPRYRGLVEDYLPPATHVDPGDLARLERELSAGDVAALILEPVQGEGGVVPVPPDVVIAWGELAARHGAHFIADEIQAGLYRAGAMSLAHEFGAPLSAVLLGKALGGGVAPISAVIGTEELFAPLLRDPFWHSMTFGGHPLSAAAALGALDALDALPGREARAAAVAGLLAELAAEHPGMIKEVRGRGFMWGIELRSARQAGSLLAELPLAGLVVSPCLGQPEVIRLLPPAILSDDELGTARARLRAALQAAYTESAPEGALV
ncbi:MAG TPA: aspartate aminotransferase family protein [Streptosporangiaceae bacterium]